LEPVQTGKYWLVSTIYYCAAIVSIRGSRCANCNTDFILACNSLHVGWMSLSYSFKAAVV
ncbi:unnamed protein product, partial [Musa banksii]